VLKNNKIDEAEKLIFDIDNFINVFNEKSKNSKIFSGIVHNWERRQNGNSVIEYTFDLGSADLIFSNTF